MKSARILAPLALAGLLVSATGFSVSTKLNLGTGYMVKGLDLGGKITHAIGIQGTLGDGKNAGTVVLDPNGCSVNRFGDPVFCTMIAVAPLPVTFVPVELADPRERGRRVYEIKGLRVRKPLSLVVPANLRGTFRLLVGDGKGGVERVLLLEQFPLK